MADFNKIQQSHAFGLAPTTIVASGGALTPPKRDGGQSLQTPTHLNQNGIQDTFELSGRRHKSVLPTAGLSSETTHSARRSFMA
jgi:hypothetical protein